MTNTNHQITALFLSKIDAKTKAEILGNIASHYGITPEQAFDEVTTGPAEHLLDYVTGSTRAAASVIMQRHGLK